MRKNKILFILHYPPPIHGSSLIGLQIKESVLINAEYECYYINLGTSKNIREIGKNAFCKIFRYIYILWQVFKNLITHRPDLCYIAITTKGAAFYKDTLIILLIKIFRVKLIFHLHNKGVNTKQEKFIDNLLYQLVFKNTKVILLSSLLYQDIKKYVSSNDLFYCPNGIPDLIVRDMSISTNSRKEKPNTNILFLSNLIESKGVYILLKACKILLNKYINFHCTFIGGIGNVSEKQFYSKVGQLGLENYVTYIGKKYGTEKESELKKADIFAFPTYYHNECFPLVLLEAMQYSLPIVSTFEGGIPDIVENGLNGYLVPQKDTNLLAEKLELLILNKNLREEMGKNGRRLYEKKFTLHHFENKLNSILDICIND